MSNVKKLQPAQGVESEPISITKPEAFNLHAFKSKRSPSLANVETLQTALPIHSLAQAKDWVRLHHDEDSYWSDECCFVCVPIKGASRDSLHLIDEDLAMQYLPSSRVARFRLALATKPHDRFFLCTVPSQNLENSFNRDNLIGCEQAKTLWTQATSRKEEGVDGYKIDRARDADAFPAPNWPSKSLDELIAVTFAGHMITTADHPGLLRLVGAEQSNE